MEHIFDTATALKPLGPNRYAGQPDPAYGNLAGPFGGTTSATLLRAILEHPKCRGQAVNQSVNFCAAIGNEAFEIKTKLIREGRYLQHWNAELHQSGEVRATAHVVTAERRETFSHHSAPMPEAKPPSDCTLVPELSGFSEWLNRYEFLFSSGEVAFGASAKSLSPAATTLWIRDRPNRPLDALSLAAMSDAFFLRLLHVRGALAPMGTVSLMTHFLADEAEIAAQGHQPVLGHADAIRFHGNFHDQHMQLWSADGKLLATGSQLVWFKS